MKYVLIQIFLFIIKMCYLFLRDKKNTQKIWIIFASRIK